MLTHAATQARRHDHRISGASLRHKLANARHFTTDVAARDVREWNLNPREAFSPPDVKMIKRACLDPDQSLILFHNGVRPLLISKLVSSSMLMKDHGLH